MGGRLKEIDSALRVVGIALAVVLAVLIIAFAVRQRDDESTEYVIIAVEDIRICGWCETKHYDRARDTWEIKMRGGAKYTAPKDKVIFASDPFVAEANDE